MNCKGAKCEIRPLGSCCHLSSRQGQLTVRSGEAGKGLRVGMCAKPPADGKHLVNFRYSHDYHWLGQMQLNLAIGQHNSGSVDVMEFRVN